MNPVGTCLWAGSTHLHVLCSPGDEVCSAAPAQLQTRKAPFCKWVYLPVKWLVTLPSSFSCPHPLTSSGFTPCS